MGHCARDYIFTVEEFGAPGAKLRATRFREAGGGMAANAAVAVARLGGRATFCGPVGDDSAGERSAVELAQAGVDVAGLRRIAGASTSVSAIVVDRRGERLVIGYRGNALEAPPDGALIAAVEAARALLVDVRWAAGAELALRTARRRETPSVLDADAAEREHLQRLCALSTQVVFSEQGLKAFAPNLPRDRALRTAIEAGAQLAAVTCGERGLYWLHGDSLRPKWMPAFRVSARDTTGAGDTFHGAYALAVGDGNTPENALRFASAAAALKCEREGARAAPSRDEVAALLGVRL